MVPVNSLLNGKLHEYVYEPAETAVTNLFSLIYLSLPLFFRQWYPLVPSEAEAIVAGMLNLRLEYVGRTLHVRGIYLTFPSFFPSTIFSLPPCLLMILCSGTRT